MDSRRLMQALKRRATAAELDEILAEMRVERDIQRRAAQLSQLRVNPRNLSVVSDLMKAALELSE